MPHLLGDLQAGVDQPHRHGVRLVQQRRDPARPGLPEDVRGPGGVAGRLGPQAQRPPRAAGRRAGQEAAQHLLQPQAALDRRLLRAVDLRLRDADQLAADRHLPGRPAQEPDLRQGHERRVVGQLGRRPRRVTGARRPRRDAQGHRGQGEARVRADLHVLPAPHLRALPEPVVRGVVPQRRDLQARGGRHRPRRPGPLPRLADVRLGLPLQEGLLQPQDRQGREVHVLLPPRRGRHPDRLLGDLRGPAALHRPGALRRRQGARGGEHRGRARAVRRPARLLPRPPRPRRAAGGRAGRHPG